MAALNTVVDEFMLHGEDTELGDEDERPFPDSDEAIRALQDVEEAMEIMEAECHRLRAELKTALAERDEARIQACEYSSLDSLSDSPESHREMRMFAERKGWDCYKEEETQ